MARRGFYDPPDPHSFDDVLASLRPKKKVKYVPTCRTANMRAAQGLGVHVRSILPHILLLLVWGGESEGIEIQAPKQDALQVVKLAHFWNQRVGPTFVRILP